MRNPIWNFKTLACMVLKIWHALKEQMHACMDNPKPICPLNFSKVGSIYRIVDSFFSIFSQFKAFGQLHKVCQKLTGYVSFFAFKWCLNYITRKPVSVVYNQERLKPVTVYPDPLGSLTPGAQDTPGYLDPHLGILTPRRQNIPYLVSCPQLP